MHNNPLVTIAVIAYNSSKFISETLDSIKNQSYNNIELIVSDDCSTDLTLEICEKWIEANRSRFVDIYLIKSTENQGIPANVNRVISKTKGVWVKLIAADDILHPHSISSFIKYSKFNINAKIITSVSQPFKDIYSKNNFSKPIQGNSTFNNKKITALQQYKMLLFRCVVHAPNVIISTDLIKTVGKFDEKFKFMEDYPYWLRVAKLGYKFYFLNRITVFYRIHSTSIYNKKTGNILFNNFYILKRPFEREYIYPNISKLAKFIYELEFLRKKMIDFCGLNKDFKLNKIIYLTSNYVNPFNLYVLLKIMKINREIKKYDK
jgi:glycosyltransferase involved in cell wall biosynthesis